MLTDIYDSCVLVIQGPPGLGADRTELVRDFQNAIFRYIRNKIGKVRNIIDRIESLVLVRSEDSNFSFGPVTYFSNFPGPVPESV